MISDRCYLGCPHEVVEELETINDKLNAEVVEQVNDTQELVLLNNFAKESNEYVFKKCLEERISDIASWRWVLDDLNQRLKDAIDTLQYEHKAIRVVIERIRDELNSHCLDATHPGALKPTCDGIEEAILQESNFLTDQKKIFESLILKLENEINTLDKTKKNIENDILKKQQTLNIEERCAKIYLESLPSGDSKRKLKRKESPIDRWENRCKSLKRTGLKALSNAIAIRQQVRGARVHLSIAAQSYATRVDSALRRRLHSNKLKLQNLYWQKDEAVRDYKSLGEELTATEQNLLETMEQERVVGTRLADRSYRPIGELTKDQVDRNLRDEQGRLRNFMKQLRTNHKRITTLQTHLTDFISRIDCCVEDIVQVIRIDEKRILQRLGEQPSDISRASTTAVAVHKRETSTINNESLESIREEDEDIEYPFDE